MNPTTPASLPINPNHVQAQFARRGTLEPAQFLYAEIGQRMLDRLAYIKLQPDTVVDAGCGTGAALAGLRARYPNMHYIGLDASARFVDTARSAYEGSRMPRWLRSVMPGRVAASQVEFRQADLANTGLAAESTDIVWSNLALHWHPEPHRVFDEWHRIVRVDGLVMFSCFGPATLREVRAALDIAGLQTATLPLVDMHDLGDLLLESGFLDPVMDQETLTLTYDDPQTLLTDIRALGGNPHPERRKGLAGKAFRERLMAGLEAQRTPAGHIPLTLEVAYGHAWRGAIQRRGNETRISVSSIKRAPRPDA